MKLFKEDFAEITTFLFYALFLFYAFMAVIMAFSPYFKDYLNLDYLLLAVIIFGFLYLILNKQQIFDDRESDTLKMRKDNLNYNLNIVDSWKVYIKDFSWLVYLIGLFVIFIIRLKTENLGLFSWLVSIIAGILIVLISFLFSGKNE